MPIFSVCPFVSCAEDEASSSDSEGEHERLRREADGTSAAGGTYAGRPRG